MWNRTAAFFFCVLLAGSTAAAGGDEEGCLFCHRLGIVRNIGERAVSLRVWDPPGGPHAKLYCSDCHPDAKNAPHAVPPGPARCIGECHGSTGTATESHRRAAYGGLTEAHRSVAAPFAPCRDCHGAVDPAGNAERIVLRCGKCHASEAGSLARGIHARLPRAAACAGCHPPHREDRAEGPKVSCEGDGCHRGMSVRKIGLAGHDVPGPDGEAGRAVGRPGLFLLIVLSGWASGRFLSPPSSRKGTPK